MSLDERVASAGGCDIQYRELGTSAATPVVMLHGGGGCRMDRRAFDGLAERYRLLLPSLPGFDGASAGTCNDIVDVADGMISPASAEHFVGQIPNAKLVTIDGGPHVLSAAAPDQFLAQVVNFLQLGVLAA